MNSQPTTSIKLTGPVEREEMVQMMMMTFLPAALMVIRLTILAVHG